LTELAPRRQDDLASSARVPESKSATDDDYDDTIAFGSGALPVVRQRATAGYC